MLLKSINTNILILNPVALEYSGVPLDEWLAEIGICLVLGFTLIYWKQVSSLKTHQNATIIHYVWIKRLLGMLQRYWIFKTELKIF